MILAVCLLMVGGCSRLRPLPSKQYVYVTAKQTFLRDRVAAVSERTGTVQNGQRLEVLDHGRRFYRVKTEAGEVGWIDEKSVATQQIYDQFKALQGEHKGDPVIASAVVRDEVNLHLKPGRDTDRFYRLAEGDKLQLLERATLPKPLAGGVVPKVAKVLGKGAKAGGTDAVAAPPPIAMEDWWLVRDTHGRVGWVLSRMMEVDVPDSLSQYAEGQRFVGAYVLTTVHDDAVPAKDSEGKVVREKKGRAKGGEAGGDESEPRQSLDVPIYLAMLGPYTAGLPYDFDQVRVFTWSLKMHRYETAFREKNIEGYLPATIRMAKDPYGKAGLAQTPEPTFTYRVLAADAAVVVPDPGTGVIKPGRTIEKTYRLEGNLVRRVAPPGYKDDPEAHPVAEEKKVGKKK